MSKPVTISMLELLQTGGFAALPFGLTYPELIERLGEPDAAVPASHKNLTPRLLRYGNVELIVDTQRGLFWSFLWEPFDGNFPLGNEYLRVDPWILSGDCAIEPVQQALATANISYVSTTNDQGNLVLKLESRVIFHFANTNNGLGKSTLSLVSATQREVLPPWEPEKQLSVTVTKSEYECLKPLAMRSGVSVGRLCANWIRERLAQQENKAA